MPKSKPPPPRTRVRVPFNITLSRDAIFALNTLAPDDTSASRMVERLILEATERAGRVACAKCGAFYVHHAWCGRRAPKEVT